MPIIKLKALNRAEDVAQYIGDFDFAGDLPQSGDHFTVHDEHGNEQMVQATEAPSQSGEIWWATVAHLGNAANFTAANPEIVFTGPIPRVRGG